MSNAAVTDTTVFTSEAINAEPLDYGVVSLSRPAHSVKVIIRGKHDNPAFAKAVTNATSLALPSRANSVVAQDSAELVWLGPDELLYRLHTDTIDAVSTVQRLQNSLQGIHSAVVDVSDYYTTMQLDGVNARRVLRKGTPLNLDEVLSEADDCAQTRLGHAAILLTQSGEGFMLQVRWTYAEYLWSFLAESMLEYKP